MFGSINTLLIIVLAVALVRVRIFKEYERGVVFRLVKVSLVAVKDIDLPQEMQRAMAKQAEAERERRAKVIHAEGEFQAARKLSDAAEIMAKQPAVFHLRFLQALSQVAIEKNQTIIVPVPIDLLGSVLERTAQA